MFIRNEPYSTLKVVVCMDRQSLLSIHIAIHNVTHTLSRRTSQGCHVGHIGCVFRIRGWCRHPLACNSTYLVTNLFVCFSWTRFECSGLVNEPAEGLAFWSSSFDAPQDAFHLEYFPIRFRHDRDPKRIGSPRPTSLVPRPRSPSATWQLWGFPPSSPRPTAEDLPLDPIENILSRRASLGLRFSLLFDRVGSGTDREA